MCFLWSNRSRHCRYQGRSTSILRWDDRCCLLVAKEQQLTSSGTIIWGPVVPNSIGDVKRLLRGIVEGTETIPVPDQEQVKRFDYRSLTGELAALLDSRSGRAESPPIHTILPEGSLR